MSFNKTSCSYARGHHGRRCGPSHHHRLFLWLAAGTNCSNAPMFRRSASRPWSSRFFQIRTRFLLVVGLFPVLLIAQWHRTRTTLVWSTDYYPFLPYTATSADQTQGTQMSSGQRFQAFDAEESHNAAPELFPDGAVRIVPANLFDPLRASGPLPVMFAGSPCKSLLLEAAERSSVLQVEHALLYNSTTRRISSWKHHDILGGPLSTSAASAAAILVDWASLERDCHVLERLLPVLAPPSLESPSNNATHLAVVYWDASNNPRPRRCPQLERDSERRIFFSYVQRSSVSRRRWNSQHQWVEWGPPAAVVSQSPEDETPAVSIHAPHPLREAFVQKLLKVARSRNVSLLPDLPRRRRKWHVAHHWRNSSTLPYSFLRHRVGRELGGLCRESRLRCLLEEVVGDPDDGDLTALERLDVTTAYVESLVSARIVVVAQHDEWEGHWRLLEGMASGALVLSDAMVAPPAGLENGTNVVFYDSADSLRRLVEHYLQDEKARLRIARKGLEYSLGSQRTWHQLERVLFGRPLTNVQDPYAVAPKRRKD